MELELEGNLVLERAQTRRWVSIVAVVVPVVACVVLAAWFIRAFIAPPMAVIPSPMQLASAPLRVVPQPPAPAPEPPQQAAIDEPPPPTPAVEPPAAPASAPMFAALSAAPPSFAPVAAFADPAKDPDLTKTEQPTDALESAAPISGPVPLPRMRPRISVALVTGPVPLPRPRPTENEAPAVSEIPDIPAFQFHGAE